MMKYTMVLLSMTGMLTINTVYATKQKQVYQYLAGPTQETPGMLQHLSQLFI